MRLLHVKSPVLTGLFYFSKFLVVCCMLSCLSAGAQDQQNVVGEQKKERYFSRERITAILVTVATGPLGGHRIYLGTEPAVPLFYVITLGGGLGILPLIDLVHILCARDLDAWINNRHILGWQRSE